MTNFTYRSKLIRSPFIIAALIGLLDLTGGFISTVSDIWWLAFDTMVKDPTVFATHTIQYGVIFVGLTIGAIALLTGIFATIYLIRRFIKSGGLDAEIKVEYTHKKECALQCKRDKIFRK